MPEQPEPMTAPEITHAAQLVADSLGATLNRWTAELASSLRPGNNVRDMPADQIVFANMSVQPGSAAMLIPAQEARTRVTLIAAEAGVYLTSEAGTPPGSATTMALPAGVPIRLHTRSAVYAVAESVAVTVDFATEFNRYGL